MRAEGPETARRLGRNRLAYALLVLVVILLGLASRKFTHLFPAAFGKYPGDVFWALMVFFLVCFVLPRSPTRTCGLVALGFSVCIEFLKLLHAPWLETLRDNRLGRLVFGFTFSWANLGCYALGILVGAGIDRLLTARKVST